MMTWPEFWIVFVSCAITMIACRVLPLFILKGKELPPALSRALGFIPPAAFAALVANDLFVPGSFASGIWPAAIPFVAAACVVVVGVKTKSLLWSGVTGVVAYALLMMI